jgi:hypothetical protein
MMTVKSLYLDRVCVIGPAISIESSVYGAVGMSNGSMFILFFVLNGLNR